MGVVTASLGLETKHSNHLGWALLLAGTAFTTIGCVYLGSLFIRDGGKQAERDRSLWLPALIVLVISLVTPLEYLFLPTVLPRSDLAQDIGLILFAGGLASYLVSSRLHGQQAAPVKRPTGRSMQSIAAMVSIFQSILPASLLLMMLGLGIGYSSLTGLFILLLLVLFVYFRGKMDHHKYSPAK